jgi:CheY-like chemotaxis protein
VSPLNSATAVEGSDESCVLVVEDEDDMREALREVIEMAGCKALLAANGADALKLLEARRPCLIILDLFMPVMTGFEMLEAMRRQPALAALPVVISTSAPGRAPPGVPVLPKPIDINHVWEWMHKTCRCARPAPAV